MTPQSFWASQRRIKSAISKHHWGYGMEGSDNSSSYQGHFLKCLNLWDTTLQGCAADFQFLLCALTPTFKCKIAALCILLQCTSISVFISSGSSLGGWTGCLESARSPIILLSDAVVRFVPNQQPPYVQFPHLKNGVMRPSERQSYRPLQAFPSILVLQQFLCLHEVASDDVFSVGD